MLIECSLVLIALFYELRQRLNSLRNAKGDPGQKLSIVSNLDGSQDNFDLALIDSIFPR